MRIEPNLNITQSFTQPVKPQVPEKSEDFAQKLMDAIKEVNQAQTESQKVQDSYLAGQPVEIHDLMIAMERASTAMQLTMQVRNKLLEAYQELNRMQI